MSKLIIEETRCTKDNICIDECPRQIIRPNSNTGLPEIKPENKNDCIRCGHCVAVCPHDALDHTLVPKAKCPPIDHAFEVGKNQAVQFFRTRRSARVFADKPVEKEKIRALIHLARYAPNANNFQALEWIVLTDKNRITELAAKTIDWMRVLIETGGEAVYSSYIVPLVSAWDKGFDRLLRHAPTVVFAAAPETAFYGMVDLTIALSHLELAAPSEGLAGCWAGLLHRAMLQYEPLRSSVGLTESYPYFYPMMLGYPKYRYNRIPERKTPLIHWR